MLTVAGDRQPLPPVAARVDRALCELDDRIDWLAAFSPFDTHRLWRNFADSGHRNVPQPTYEPQNPELPALRRRLLALPVEAVEPPALRALLGEKQREIDRHIELIELRDTDGVLAASIDLWGDVEPGLRVQAEAVLASLHGRHEPGAPVGLDTVLPAARTLLAHYRDLDPRLASRIVVDDHLSSRLMVSQGHLHIDRRIQVPGDQVEPLMQHEIGTHVLTRHNGRLQPIEQLGTGLAHYDSLQEGLGVLAEYLSGHLSADRLRVIAARVLATDLICQGADIPRIYHRLRDADLDEHDAFDVALRAGRGSGLTKDVVYLRGLGDLLAYLGRGGSIEDLFVGKFSLSHLGALEQLARQGYVTAPALLPTYLNTETGRRRLQRCRNLTLVELAKEDLTS